ncbi:hypothetical protein F441_06805 [Phytophthora nicotianae CJ01A1]|uniref:Uncharacterized protein n=6 Tax=Phytophthora nicotianae TaxID=4792 RepID=W2RF27_PHYN3|nr:hypothetical protein PPTG_20983 [Phytophthora nicotianae INRA-310]ETI49306.1 hypothetical protein F443_06801 [Phytophthora nicotianae P1569]ETL42612.1 hypothetical protein L916_06611 [Phytophthora nicotianae]ETO78033.1 hypothetical protein F444_06871 [Phytophthora nicotianae P1976]ETP19041.1 hypothetical protein F441_06805 [Phytophthora nicotianae CJ01A1]ETP46988.1 hypothetical protein F442_06837 [Phytophthora nicotianae P10297]KUF90473.1 hypothetical protein AM587_10013013 [Phytophthora n
MEIKIRVSGANIFATINRITTIKRLEHEESAYPGIDRYESQSIIDGAVPAGVEISSGERLSTKSADQLQQF